ncbi:NUDIX domain-containing protein [Leuconostoc sp. JNUCC 76]
MRQPINIHLFLYRTNQFGQYEFAIFQRTDDKKCWQGISGGVEDNETLEDAVYRECVEETGSALDRPIFCLDSKSYIPANNFLNYELWGEEVLVCPMYFFAAEFSKKIILTKAHENFDWLQFDDAYQRVFWHDQKNALWELNQRLIRVQLKREF